MPTSRVIVIQQGRENAGIAENKRGREEEQKILMVS